MPDGEIKIYNLSANSYQQDSQLQNLNIDESGIHDSLKLAISIFLFLFILIPVIFSQNQDCIKFFLLVFLDIVFFAINIIFLFYTHYYFKKMSQLFDIVKETYFKEENPELFKELKFISKFKNIILYYIIIFLSIIVLLGIYFLSTFSKIRDLDKAISEQEESKNENSNLENRHTYDFKIKFFAKQKDPLMLGFLCFLFLFICYQIIFIIFLLIAYFKQKNKITINPMIKEEIEKDEEIKQEEEIEKDEEIEI